MYHISAWETSGAWSPYLRVPFPPGAEIEPWVPLSVCLWGASSCTLSLVSCERYSSSLALQPPPPSGSPNVTPKYYWFLPTWRLPNIIFSEHLGQRSPIGRLPTKCCPWPCFIVLFPVFYKTGNFMCKCKYLASLEKLEYWQCWVLVFSYDKLAGACALSFGKVPTITRDFTSGPLGVLIKVLNLFHWFSEYILSIFSMSVLVLGTGDIEMTARTESPVLMGFIFWWRR